MLTVKDSVHSHIDLDGVGEALLDTAPVQRLRYIRQLGTVHLVYPSANHTRFEHSLGVYHLARRAVDHLDVAGRTARRIEAAAVIHDIGHAPFSHNLEGIVTAATGAEHDAIEHLIDAAPIAHVLAEYDLEPGAVARLIRGEGPLGALIAGDLDVDRMDYLIRDAHHTGVPYGTVDPGRLLRALTVIDGTLVLGEASLQSAENLLIARALMNPTVYNHHVARISKAMLRRGVRLLQGEDALESALSPTIDPWVETDVDVHPLRRATDHDVLRALHTTARSQSLAQRLLERRLYKRAVWADRESVPDALSDIEAADLHGHERAIAERAGVAAEQVILDMPPDRPMREATSPLLINGEVSQLDRHSPLVRSLQENHRANWRLGVYTPPEHVDEVGEAAVAELGLDVSGALVQDRRTAFNHDLTEFIES